MILCRNQVLFLFVIVLFDDSIGFKIGEKIKSGLSFRKSGDEKGKKLKDDNSEDSGFDDEFQSDSSLRKNDDRGDSKDERKLRQKIAEIFDKNDLDQNFLYNMISDGNAYVIIDCQQPSYIKSNHEPVVLKNHILNDHLKRKQNPDYNETDAYICDRAENVWRINPEVFGGNSGFIGFDESRPGEADSNFVTFADESTIGEYLKNRDAKLVKKVVELTFRLIHHPKYFRVSKKKPTKEMDVFVEQEKRLPKWFREKRQREMDELFERITTTTTNFSFLDKGKNMKDYLFGGDGYSLVLFDCESPSYLFPKGDRNSPMDVVKIESPELRLVLRKFGKCEKSENIWRRYRDKDTNKPHRVVDISQLNYLTFDIKSNGLGYSPSLELLKILKLKGFCNDFMKFLHHPVYFTLPMSNKFRFKKPGECLSMQSDLDEEEKIAKIVKKGRKISSASSNNNNKKMNLKSDSNKKGEDDQFQEIDFHDFNSLL